MQYTDIMKNAIDNSASHIDIMVSNDIQVQKDENKLIVCQILFISWESRDFHFVVIEDLCTTKILEISLLYCALLRVILFILIMSISEGPSQLYFPKSQNNIITVIGHDNHILAEVKQSRF